MSKLVPILADTWRGLIQRRLWPVAVLLLAGLVAVPLLLTSEPEPVAPLPANASEEAAELAAQPLVTVASAAERETGRRVLGARKDPFKSKRRPEAKAKQQSDGGSGDAGTSKSSAASTPASGTVPTPGSGGSYAAPPVPATSPPGSDDRKPKRPAGSLTVRWGIAGDPVLERLDVKRLDPLPTTEEPLLVYMGLTPDRRSAVFMIDADLAVDGDGRCRPTPDDCQSVELKPGETAFLTVTGDDDRTTEYQLDLVKIHGRRAAPTQSPTKDAAIEARATRRALRSLGHAEPAYRFDARTGTLERIDARN